MSSIIRLQNNVGPAEALQLKARLAELSQLPRPLIKVDLSEVTSLHLGAANSLVQAARTATTKAGSFQIVRPQNPEPIEVLKTAGLTPWLT